ncbi:hypothetical protein SUGI_0644020 [Cryptomeria japonica]|nr:hypothetical protein SUGI_0644020 [Cryptomeria japonica]
MEEKTNTKTVCPPVIDRSIKTPASIFGLIKARQISSSPGVSLRYERAIISLLLKGHPFETSQHLFMEIQSPVEKIFTLSNLLIALWDNQTCIVFKVGAKAENLYRFNGIKDVIYNIHTDSLIFIVKSGAVRLLTRKVEDIRHGLEDEWETLFPTENAIEWWDFDVPNCLGMLYINNENLFKIFELENYNQLYTVANRARSFKDFRFGSPGNMEMVMFHARQRRSLVDNFLALGLTSKHNGCGKLQRVYFNQPDFLVNDVRVCGDKVVVFLHNRLKAVELLSGKHTVILESDAIFDFSIVIADSNPDNQYVLFSNIAFHNASLANSDFYMHKYRILILQTEDEQIGLWNMENSITASGRAKPVRVFDIGGERLERPSLYNLATYRQDVIISHCQGVLRRPFPVMTSKFMVISLSFPSGHLSAVVNSDAMTFHSWSCFWYDDITGNIFFGYQGGDLCILSPQWI